MRVAVIIAIVATACSTRAPKTYDSMLRARLAESTCRRTCPLGDPIDPVEPQAEHILDDCCTDPMGLTWASCAWNASGRYMTAPELMATSRLGGSCGTDGYPDCPVGSAQ